MTPSVIIMILILVSECQSSCTHGSKVFPYIFHIKPFIFKTFSWSHSLSDFHENFSIKCRNKYSPIFLCRPSLRLFFFLLEAWDNDSSNNNKSRRTAEESRTKMNIVCSSYNFQIILFLLPLKNWFKNKV